MGTVSSMVSESQLPTYFSVSSITMAVCVSVCMQERANILNKWKNLIMKYQEELSKIVTLEVVGTGVHIMQ